MTLFLLIGIVLLVKILMIVRDLKKITEKAIKIADSAEAIGSFFQKTASPVAVSKFLYNITESVLHHQKKHKRGDDNEERY